MPSKVSPSTSKPSKSNSDLFPSYNRIDFKGAKVDSFLSNNNSNNNSRINRIGNGSSQIVQKQDQREYHVDDSRRSWHHRHHQQELIGGISSNRKEVVPRALSYSERDDKATAWVLPKDSFEVMSGRHTTKIGHNRNGLRRSSSARYASHSSNSFGTNGHMTTNSSAHRRSTVAVQRPSTPMFQNQPIMNRTRTKTTGLNQGKNNNNSSTDLMDFMETIDESSQTSSNSVFVTETNHGSVNNTKKDKHQRSVSTTTAANHKTCSDSVQEETPMQCISTCIIL